MPNLRVTQSYMAVCVLAASLPGSCAKTMKQQSLESECATPQPSLLQQRQYITKENSMWTTWAMFDSNYSLIFGCWLNNLATSGTRSSLALTCLDPAACGVVKAKAAKYPNLQIHLLQNGSLVLPQSAGSVLQEAKDLVKWPSDLYSSFFFSGSVITNANYRKRRASQRH